VTRFSFNQATANRWPIPDLVAGCVAAGVTRVGLWREQVAEFGLEKTAALVKDAGLEVTSLCRGGFFQTPTWYEENSRAVAEAHTLGAPVLVLVSGGLPPGSRDVDTARRHVGEAIGRLVPAAVEAGVRLAIEPLHPMMISERSAIVTLGEANDLAERFDDTRVGVVVDAYHVWWDPRLYEEIARAGRRILGYHVADWLVPTTDRLQGRGMMGTGVIELKRIRAAVEEAGYDGPIEVEVINRDAWDRPGDDIVAEACEAFLTAA
jgi:sugar phosphate isomerase/epimerase